MPGYVNGIPHATSTDRIDLWPTTSRNLAQWVDDNVPRNDDPRLSNARPPTTHTHPISGVTGLQAALNGKTNTTDPRLSDARPPTAHTHALADVTGLQAALYDSGRRDITQLATGIAAGKMFLRVKSGWARITFIDVVPSAAGNAWLFGNDSVLAPWAPTDATEDGMGAVTLDIGGGANRYPVLHRLTHRGAMAVYNVPANARINGFIFWPFDRTPPTTPIGSPT